MTKKKKPTKKGTVKAAGKAGKTPALPAKRLSGSKPDKAVSRDQGAKTATVAPPPPTAPRDTIKKTASHEKVRQAAEPVAASSPPGPNADNGPSAKSPALDKQTARQSQHARSGKPKVALVAQGATSEGGNNAGSEIGAVSDAVSEAALPLQTFAIEMQRMAKQTVEQTTTVLEHLRAAKSVEEVVSLQTTFMQQSFRRYTDFAGRISQLMSASQASLFQQSQAAMRTLRSIATGI